jgi:hypothetical protein
MGMTKGRNGRPPVAVGHVFFAATDVADAARWFESVGLRPIVRDDDFAVLELRGGTQLVVSKAARAPRGGGAAPFDLMVDDIESAREEYAAQGLKPSRIRRGTLHDEFSLVGPDGYRVAVLATHAGRHIA